MPAVFQVHLDCVLLDHIGADQIVGNLSILIPQDLPLLGTPAPHHLKQSLSLKGRDPIAGIIWKRSSQTASSVMRMQTPGG